MKISILGTDYTITKKAYADDPYFKEHSSDGFCDSLLHQIVICDITTYPEWEKEPKERAALAEQETLRHEIIHAFLDESGLQGCALTLDGAWSKNEEMVDWFALLGPKIAAAWKQAGCLPGI